MAKKNDGVQSAKAVDRQRKKQVEQVMRRREELLRQKQKQERAKARAEEKKRRQEEEARRAIWIKSTQSWTIVNKVDK